MHNLQNRLTSCRGTFRGREDSNGLLGGPRILLTMDINSDGRHKGKKTGQSVHTHHKES